MLPICEVTDQFTAKRGKRQPGTWKREQEERCRLCCILRNLCLTEMQGNFPEPSGPQLRHSWCTWLPSRRDKNVSVKERRLTQHGLCSRHLHRELGSLQAYGVSSLPLSQATEDVQEHPTMATPHTVGPQVCSELLPWSKRRKDTHATQHREGDGDTGPRNGSLKSSFDHYKHNPPALQRRTKPPATPPPHLI